MKPLRLFTVMALTGTLSLMASGSYQKEQHDCTNQYTISIGTPLSNSKIGKKHYRKNPSRSIIRLMQKLDLTETQKNQLQEIRKSMWQARKTERKKFKDRLKLKSFISVDGFDKEGFVMISQQRAIEIASVRADFMEKVIAVLSPEQRLELLKQLNIRAQGKRHQPK